MKKLNFKFLLILSCLILTATQLVFAQNEFNKKPLQDFADNLSRKVEIKEVDLDKPFSVTLEGYLTKEGKLDGKRSKFTKAEGDEKMINIARTGIEAVNDSGLLAYLSGLGVEKIKIVLSQDDKNVSTVIKSELATEAKAKTIASGFNGLLKIASMNEKDEETKFLLNATNCSVESNNFSLNITLPKEEVQRMIKNKLQKAKEKSYSN